MYTMRLREVRLKSSIWRPDWVPTNTSHSKLCVECILWCNHFQPTLKRNQTNVTSHLLPLSFFSTIVLNSVCHHRCSITLHFLLAYRSFLSPIIIITTTNHAHHHLLHKTNTQSGKLTSLAVKVCVFLSLYAHSTRHPKAIFLLILCLHAIILRNHPSIQFNHHNPPQNSRFICIMLSLRIHTLSRSTGPTARSTMHTSPHPYTYATCKG